MKAFGLLLLLGMGLGLSAGDARAFWLAEFPACSEPEVLRRVTSRFNTSEVYGRLTRILTVQHPTERTTEYFGPHPIPRRYCRGLAVLANGSSRNVWYLIEGGMGLAGTGFKVEMCLDGYDPWRVYDGACRTLRR